MPRGVYSRPQVSVDPAFVPFAPGRGVGHVVDPRTGCWNWQGRTNSKGYGQVHFGHGRSSTKIAHRVYFERAHGPIPAAHDIDHLCRNTSCVNPGHLEAVRSEVNQRRAPRTKLTADLVRELRRRHRAGGLTFRQLGAAYGLKKTTVQLAVTGVNWASVE